MDPGSRRQLDTLRKVVALFDEAGVEHWLFGGWAEEDAAKDRADSAVLAAMARD